MQPCQVCGGMAVDAAGYCTQCRTYRGPVPPAPYPAQPSGPPYAVQPSGPPYVTQSSGPPYGGPAPARNPFLIPLIALCAAVVLVAAGIVVVVVVKSNNRNQAGGTTTGPTLSPGASAAIDPCLVGTWTVTKATQQYSIAGVGTVQLAAQGATQTVVVRADGTANDDYGTDTKYQGALGGHTYTLDVTGTVSYSIRTANSTITFVSPTANGTITATVDGLGSTSAPLSISEDPVHYTCSGDTATEHTDTYDATLTKVG
ncbi:MAG TPA: hypothetical protein VJT31_40290 [Rugosimonospora sp.]|nr:hypothetical protein [Rugosimonospora sp.]